MIKLLYIVATCIPFMIHAVSLAKPFRGDVELREKRDILWNEAMYMLIYAVLASIISVLAYKDFLPHFTIGTLITMAYLFNLRTNAMWLSLRMKDAMDNDLAVQHFTEFHSNYCRQPVVVRALLTVGGLAFTAWMVSI